MIHRRGSGRARVLASAIAGLILMGCNRNEEKTVNPTVEEIVSGDGSHTANHGYLAAPEIPTAAQIRELESQTPSSVASGSPVDQSGAVRLAKTSAGDINVGFNDYASLAQLQDHAYTFFTTDYFQWVTSTSYAVVHSIKYAHFHLVYENPNDCYFGYNGAVPPGQYGQKSGNNCIQKGDAATQPRYLSPHLQDDVFQVYVYDRVKIHTFDFKSFYLPPTSDTRFGHVQIWIHKIDVGWRYWSDLPPATTGYTWYLPQTGIGGAQGIDEIRIQAPNPNASTGFSIDNIMINNIL